MRERTHTGGIDPGKDGGYCSLSADGVIQELMPLSEALELLVSGKLLMPGHMWIEKAQVMNIRRRDGSEGLPSAVAMFSYGSGFGEILGIMKALKVPHTLVRPADWCRQMHRGTKMQTADKMRSFEAGRRLFPDQTWMWGNRRKPHDGLCEAALIAEYGRRQLGGVSCVTIDEPSHLTKEDIEVFSEHILTFGVQT